VSLRDFFRRHVVHNLALKLTSLALAAGLWLAVASSPPSEIAVNVPIIFRDMPANLEISSENIPSVRILVRGPESIVRRLQASDVHAEIELTGIKPGERTFDLTHQIQVPDKLEVAQVEPAEVEIAFDTRATRSVAVRPRIIGNFVAGYKVASVEADPAMVEITGPKKIVDSIAAATTDPIDVSGVLDRISAARHAYVSDPLIQVTSPRAVRVTVTMEKETADSETQSQ
jgi:YbbR domain-containing protein